ncbi:MAG: hypothetical protein WA688_05565 [Thermoplasmata archaeon]
MTANPVTGANSFHYERYDLLGRLRRRLLASIAATVGWLSLILLYLAFGAQHFNLFQDIVVVVVSLLVLAGFLLGAWISFGLRFIDHWSD